MENNRLKLRIPTYEDLNYRRKLLLCSETMSYNKGYSGQDGYDSETGCIDFNEKSWSDWFSRWVNNTPDRYYAYVIKCDENIPIGEVALRYDNEKNAYWVNIIIEAKFRGKGYSEEALRLLIDVAFCELSANIIFDEFPKTRISAEKVFRKIGFKRVSDDIVELSKEDYWEATIL